LSAVAVTDHDTVAGVPAARAAADGHAIEVVAGVELSAFDARGAEVHVLGLHLADDSKLAAPLAGFQADRVTRAEAIVAALNRAGVPITVDAVMVEAGPGSVGRPHVARALVAGGWVRDLREAFDRWLGADRPAFVEKPRLEVADAVRLIHDAGGVAIWAHPGRDGTRARIESFVAVGLDGVEVYHPGHSADDTGRLNTLAGHLNLVRSGGSDWHGAAEVRAPSAPCACPRPGTTPSSSAPRAIGPWPRMDLTGRVALVTGAGRRIGRELALALGRRGARVAVHFNSSSAGAEATAAALRAAGAEARTFGADLSDAREAGKLVDTVADAFGALDVLINSAGIMHRVPVADVTPELWDETFDINLRSQFFTSQAAARRMPATGGVIVNMADLAAFEAWTGYVPHCVSKAGVVALTKALAHALAPRIRVNAIAPGAVLLPESMDQAMTDHLVRTTPLERLGAPADVVHAMLYLLDAGYVTGETIIVDGGRHVRT